jgi:hypothetical protein
MSLPNYDNLFHGAARLGILFGSLKLPWARITNYVSTFSEELNAYQEMSLDGTGTTLGLMTRGSGKDYVFRVGRYMENHGIDEERLRLLLVRARFFQHRNLFFKVEVGPEGPTEFSYYFRQRASLDIARAWLANAGVSEAGLAVLESCARELEKHSVHFLAASERPDGESQQKIYFSQPDDGKAWDRVRKAGRIVGLTEASWQPVEDCGNAIVDKSPFFSIAFSNGQLATKAKLDIPGPDSTTVKTLMARNGLSRKAYDRTRLLLELFRKDQFDYLGLTLHPDASFETKVYAYQGN